MESLVLKNISYRIYFFLFALFIFGSSSTLFFTNNGEIHGAIGKEVPNIEMHDFTLYLINDRYVQVIAEGEEVFRYEDREEFRNVLLKQLNRNMQEQLKAPIFISQNNLYTFPRSVTYTRSDGLTFWSDVGSYDYKSRVFQGEGEFTMDNTVMSTYGYNIYYDEINAILKADKINADIMLGVKR